MVDYSVLLPRAQGAGSLKNRIVFYAPGLLAAELYFARTIKNFIRAGFSALASSGQKKEEKKA